MFSILVICTANICRSPVAEQILANAFIGAAVDVWSAGTHAPIGEKADPVMCALMAEKGLTGIFSHRSRALTQQMLKDSQLILCMESVHIERIQRASVITTGKTLLLGHWNKMREVADPVGKSAGIYAGAMDEIQELCEQWVERINNMGLNG